MMSCRFPSVSYVCHAFTSTMLFCLILVSGSVLSQAAPVKPANKPVAPVTKKVDDTLVVGVIAESEMTPRTVTVGSEFQGTLVTETSTGNRIGGTNAGLPEGTQFIGHVIKAENTHLSQENNRAQVTKVTIQLDTLIFPDGKVLPFLDPIPTRAHSELKLSWADQGTPKMVQANQPPKTAMACQRMPKGALYPGDLVYLRLNRAALSNTLSEGNAWHPTTP